jgi:hypothetical protein
LEAAVLSLFEINRKASSPGNTDGELQFRYELIKKNNKEPLSCAGTQGIFFVGWH